MAAGPEGPAVQRKQLVATLTRLTEALGPGPGTNDGDLRRARVRLARALVAGQAADELGASLAFTDVWERDVHAVEDDGLEHIALSAIDDRRRRRAESRPTLDVFAAPRTLPVRHPFDPREPASVVGMRATETLGPFVDGDGIARWIDLIQPLRQLPLARGTGAAAVFGSLPVLGRQTDPRRLRLGRGSVWLAARLLARNAPTGSFTGVRIRRGTLTLDGGAAVTADRIRLGPATIATLTVELDLSAPPVAATGPASAEHPASSSGIGGDATAATVTLPATATIVLHPTAAIVADLAPFGVEAYGSDPIALARSVESPPRYVPALRHVLVPATPTPNTLNARFHLSALFSLSGSAEIAGAGWALPVAQTTADKLGPAEGAGAVALLLGTGLEIGWSGLAQPALSASPNLLVGPGMLSVTFTQTEPEYGQKFLLWDERRTGGPPRRSTAEYRFSKGSTLTYLAQPGLEALLATGGTAAAKVDRPVRADGRRLPLALPTAQLGIWDQGQGEQVFLFGTDPNAQEASHLALALDNALLRVRPPGSLLLTGKLTGDEVPEGRMTLGFSLRSLVHTLPDPYAARRFRGDREGDVDIGVISSRVAWTHPNTPELAFSIPESVDGGGRRGRLTFATLLDVSSAADQLGVFVGPRSQGQPLVVHGLTVHAPGNRVGVFTVPEISWEPVYNHPSSPPPAPIAPPHDGGPSTFTVPTVHLVPVAPAPMLADLLAGIENGGEVDSRITLPFGIEARIRDSVGATFALNQPLFPDDMAGALQVRRCGCSRPGPGRRRRASPARRTRWATRSTATAPGSSAGTRPSWTRPSSSTPTSRRRCRCAATTSAGTAPASSATGARRTRITPASSRPTSTCSSGGRPTR